MGEETPICRTHIENLRRLLLRALNKNQILILSELKNNKDRTITSALRRISKSFHIPLSTLKLNAKILRKLDLISFNNSKPVRLTDIGEILINIIEGDSNGK